MTGRTVADAPDDRGPGVVLWGAGGVWSVRMDDGATYDATLRGRLKQAGESKLAVGDRVIVAPDRRGGAWAIEEILPRQSALSRRTPGGGQGERVIAANVGQVVVVFAAAQPEPHRRMVDRFLVIAESNRLPARLVVNKVDLVDGASAHAQFADYERAGYEVHYTSTRTGEGLRHLVQALAGRTSVVAGPSGVGKSSLLNSLFPGLDLRVGAISAAVQKGRHTTVGARLVPLPDSTYVVDTPGLREVGLWAVPAAALDRCFPEFRPFVDQCRFVDCTHRVEPGCAVRGAVRDGVISAERYESYVTLRSELA